MILKLAFLFALASPRAPVLVELFTSEGCSSCPPADALLIELDEKQPVPGAEIIVLSHHVDYWDRLGWRDPFSSAQATHRQQEYARKFGEDKVYTPQMVVDGREEFVGSQGRKAWTAIAAAAQTPKANLRVSKNGERLKIELDATMPRADVILAITENGLKSSVARGENAGRRLAHNGVVRRWQTLGRGPVIEPELHLDASWKREHLRAVVLVQERSSRNVLAAAAIRLSD
jgi:hypothetical protein